MTLDKPDKLLQLISQLQGNISVANGRHLLLDYIRRSSGAQLVLLFLVDKENQALVLLDRCGRSPRPHYPSSSQESLDAQSLPLHGLFGSVLQEQGLLHIPDVYANPQSLPGERYWTWRGGHVLLSAVRGDPQGVLVLCFAPREKEWLEETTRTAADERDLLLCITLLSAYLSRTSETLEPLKTQQIAETGAALKAAIDRERSRIARDIHDGPAQQIAHGIHRLELTQRLLEKQQEPPLVALREIGRVRKILEESLNDLRQGTLSPIPTQLEEQGLDAALRTLLENFALNEPGLDISYSLDQLHQLPPLLEVPIFRLIQEALNNVRKHAQASQVSIRIQRLSGMVHVEVSDNGVGFQMEHVLNNLRSVSHLGLRVMRERVQQAGGTLEIQSRPAAGTTLRARFPLPLLTTGMLSRREQEVLHLLVKGATNRAIAEALSISVETVKSHVHHIMQKMQVKDRTQAAVRATRELWL